MQGGKRDAQVPEIDLPRRHGLTDPLASRSTFVGVVSDTHLPRFGRQLPAALVLGLRAANVSLILHLGDWTAPFVEDLFSAVAPVQGVAGNNDPPELLERLGTRRVVDVAGVRIGLTHGHFGPGRTTPQRAMRAFADETGLAGILFGHSHIPWRERLPDGRWLVNPGSPTDRRRQPRFTWALMEIAGGAIVTVESCAYDDRRSVAPLVPGPEDHLAD